MGASAALGRFERRPGAHHSRWLISFSLNIVIKYRMRDPFGIPLGQKVIKERERERERESKPQVTSIERIGDAI
jgi:hypothetical protein